ncbi:MAG: indole-3-glycerol-phosphate synthase [Actinobacteria bacterium]|nr:indole-3-glycerol-phosphate synthase [Actinomycetota bacterium]
MSDFLDRMKVASLRRAQTLVEEVGHEALLSRTKKAPPPVPLRLGSVFDIVAEVKPASPTAGRLIEGDVSGRVAGLAAILARHGAIAVSVHTEETSFGGSIGDLESVAGAGDFPVMRKDFLVHPIQVLESRVAGASGILLIARLLTSTLLEEMVDLARGHGMFVVVEVFDLDDLETAADVMDRPVVVGVNCRDLASLEVDRGRFSEMAPHLPAGIPAMAESGLATTDDMARVAALGYRLALVGTALTTASSPGERLRGLLAAGRSEKVG